MNQDINKRLKQAREFLKLNQRAVCKALEINPSYYSGIESGKKQVTSKLIEGFRKKFNVSSDWLYTGNGELLLSDGTHQRTLNDVPPLYPSLPNEQKTDEKPLWFYGITFQEYLRENFPDLKDLQLSLSVILSFKDVLEALEKSKVGEALNIGGGGKKIKNFEQYKTIGVQRLKELLPHKDLFHGLASFMGEFEAFLKPIQEELNYDIELNLDLTPKPRRNKK